MSAYSDLIVADGAVAYWRLGEPSGVTANDEIGTADGTYVNTPDLGVTGAIVSDSDTAATFKSASTEYITVATIPAVANTLSLELWVKRTTAGVLHVLLSFPANGSQLYFGGADGNKLVFDQNGVGGILITNGGISDTTTWHHVVATKDGSTERHIYIDGAEATYSASADRTLSSMTSLTIAAQAGGSNRMNGSLDEVAIYDSILSAADVLAHYEAGIAVAAAASHGKLLMVGVG